MKTHMNCKVMAVFLAILFSMMFTVSADEPDGSPPVVWSCDDMTPNLCSNLRRTNGYVTTRNGLRIKYWKYFVGDDINEGRHEGLPLLIINGGPGMPHNYNLPLKQLACEGRHSSVIFYDQGGTGDSSIPADASLEDEYSFLLDIEYLGGEELQAIIDGAILDKNKDTKFHIIGDSFGTMVALQYVLKYSKNKSRLDHKVTIATDVNAVGTDSFKLQLLGRRLAIYGQGRTRASRRT